MLKSDQDGIESCGSQGLRRNGKFGWNQTKMGLKGGKVLAEKMNTALLLKSDQDGIESGVDLVHFYARDTLKSDQDGIESRGRPCRENRASESLKSDQDGIERAMESSRFLWTLSWNQTKMGLKLTGVISIDYEAEIVEIRV